MGNDSVAVKQLQDLQKKLENAINSRSTLEEDIKKRSSLLLKFISKLSLVCKGMSIELDNKLATLRSSLTKSLPVNEIEKQLTVISGLLQQHSQKNEANVRVIHQQFTDAGKLLQKTKGLPDKIRRELRHLLKENQSTKDTVIQYVPLLSELLTAYDAALKNKDSLPEKPLLDTEPNDGHSEVAKLDQTFLNNVEKILTHLKLSDRHQLQLISLKKEITHSKTFDDLQENLLEVFQIIAADLKQERDTAKDFLSSLSQTLKKVQKSVQKTLVNFSEDQKQNQEFNNKLQSQLTEITNKVDQADSLVNVKTDINSRLQSIADILEQKIACEVKTKVSLETQLKDMALRIQFLEKESKKFEVRLQEQLVKSMQDALTKLNNRAAFDDYFSKEIVRFHHKPFDLALVVMDLDHFKRINDTYGHTAGDKTLQVIANTLKKHIGDNAFVARYGGEEFVLIFTQKDKKNLLNKLTLVKEAIARLPFKFKNDKVTITVSMGATHITQNDNVHSAFERADTSLYQAKEQGRNQVVYA